MNIKFDDFLLERLGVNKNTMILGDFIYNAIKNNEIKENIEYKLNASNLQIEPKVKNIYLYFYRDDSKNIAGFNVSKSNETTDGFDLFFSFNLTKFDISMKGSIYHEVAHAFQFMKNPKVMKTEQNRDERSYKYISNYINKNISPEIRLLFNIVYIDNDYEMNSFINESYYVMKDVYTKYNLIFEKNSFLSLIVFTIGWYLYKNLELYDFDVEIPKIPKEELKTIFAFSKDEVFHIFLTDNNDKFYIDFDNDSIFVILKKMYKEYRLKKKIRKNLITISDKELELKIKYYKNLTKKQANKYRVKLYKLYSLLYDEFTSEEYTSKVSKYWNNVKQELIASGKNEKSANAITELKYLDELQKATDEMHNNLK